jgi:hypothetical protein
MFLNEPCDLLGVPRPDPAGPDDEKKTPGWPHDLSDEGILRRLVDLNRERAEEEKRGIIRWLPPEYQNPEGAQPAAATQGALAIEPEAPPHPRPPRPPAPNAPGPGPSPSKPRPSAPSSPTSRPA